MSIPGSLTPLFNSGPSGYSISRSLRFNSADSAYLSRTPASASNRRTWTLSFWIKRSSTDTYQIIFQAGNANNVNEAFLYFVGDGVSFYQTDGAGNTAFSARPTGVFRDHSAWYHIVLKYDSTQATSTDRVRYYINGVDRTDTSTTFPSLNFECVVNSTVTHRIGTRFAGIQYLGAYIADFQLIDGQALDSSYFGQFDSNGIWNPKKYNGSYGTNGFQINFSDNSNTTAATLGKDISPNGNNWTPNNLSVTAGVGNDSVVDSPTNGTQKDTGVGGQVVGNYCTLNPLTTKGGFVLSNGNLKGTNVVNDGAAIGTIAVPTTGKWYWEAIQETVPNIYLLYTGITPNATAENGLGSFYGIYPRNGNVCFYGSPGTNCISETASPGDVYGVAYDADAGTLDFYKNGVLYSGQTRTVTTGVQYYPFFAIGNVDPAASINFGQRPFAYAAPSGFKSLNTANLPTPTILKGSDYFDTKLWTGNGSTQTISGIGFSPDFVWIKRRDTGATSHCLHDTIRGATKGLHSDTTQSEWTDTATLTAFNSDGFNLAGHPYTNANAGTYAGWCWDAGSSNSTNTQGSITSTVRANASAGFSIVTWTGNGAGSATVGHGLNVAPAFVIVKQRGTADGLYNWNSYHKSLGSGYLIALNTTSAAAADNYIWSNTSPSSTVITLGSSTSNYQNVNNYNGTNYVAYCFAPVAGFSAFGSYTGNGSTNGPFVYTGFRPKFVIFKCSSSSATDWVIEDSVRSTYNVIDARLFPNTNDAELSNGNGNIDYLSNGFKLRNAHSAMNSSGATYIYMALAENPFSIARAR